VATTRKDRELVAVDSPALHGKTGPGCPKGERVKVAAGKRDDNATAGEIVFCVAHDHTVFKSNPRV
jgi:hypothetical protein